MNSSSRPVFLLAIETSCDETSVALMKNNEVVECLTWDQIEHFISYGGVVPQIASRLHMEKLPILLETLIKKHPQTWNNIQYIAYTAKPGLIGCLRIGEAAAHTIALEKNLPLIPINHLEAHIYAVTLEDVIQFPALALIVSGGHTQLVYLSHELNFKIIGSTVDDAVGEVIDKIARKLNLGYPGGPAIEALAENGRPIYSLSVYENKKDFDFSFSGLKTNAIHLIEKQQQLNDFSINDFASSFQNKIFHVLAKKINLANGKYKIKNLILCGGVASNQALRIYLQQHCNLPLLVPEKKYCIDNAAMVGVLAFHQIQNKITKKNEKIIK